MKQRHTKVSDCDRTILESLNTALLLFDSELKLQFMNPAAEMLFTVSYRHLVGTDAQGLLRCPEEECGLNLARVLESGHPFTRREMVLSLPEGKFATVDCAVSEIPGTGVLVELQRLDRHLRISREEQLRWQHDAVRELVRGMAHEIKNPLGGLRGAAQLLEDELAEPQLKEYTQIIMAEADRLQKLVDRMLGPNRLPEFREVNIHTLLERVRHLVLAEEGHNLQIERDYDPSIPDVRVDRDTIIQAVLNIVRNAARAVREQSDGKLQLRTRILRQFTIGPTRHRLVIQIRIADNGPGIPEAVRHKLFFPLVSPNEGGMGVGLSISQSLVQKHGGLVECSSRPGATHFDVLLPMESPHAKG